MEAPLCRVCKKRHWGNCPTMGPLSEEPPKPVGSVAQLVEQRPFKPTAAGSTPARPTKKIEGEKLELPAHLVREAEAVAAMPDSEIDTSDIPEVDDNPWPKGEPGGIVVDYDFKAAANCPECAMRRAKKALSMKRWREKRRGENKAGVA